MKLNVAGACLEPEEVVDALNGDKHPLLNPESKHYQMVDGVEAVERLEQMFSEEDMKIWAKITAMKYRLRIGNKDAVGKEVVKIRGYEAYYKYLDNNEN